MRMGKRRVSGTGYSLWAARRARRFEVVDGGEFFSLEALLSNSSSARARSLGVPICATISRIRVAASMVHTRSLPSRAGYRHSGRRWSRASSSI